MTRTAMPGRPPTRCPKLTKATRDLITLIFIDAFGVPPTPTELNAWEWRFERYTPRAAIEMMNKECTFTIMSVAQVQAKYAAGDYAPDAHASKNSTKHGALVGLATFFKRHWKPFAAVGAGIGVATGLAVGLVKKKRRLM